MEYQNRDKATCRLSASSIKRKKLAPGITAEVIHRSVWLIPLGRTGFTTGNKEARHCNLFCGIRTIRWIHAYGEKASIHDGGNGGLGIAACGWAIGGGHYGGVGTMAVRDEENVSGSICR